MSTTKKRHIQESNLILEQRHLQKEGLFIERRLPEDVVDNALKISILKEPTKSSEFNKLLSDNSKDKYKKWSNRETIFNALKISDEWCKSKTILPGMTDDDIHKFPCIDINDYLVGESDSMLSGFLGIFGKLTS